MEDTKQRQASKPVLWLCTEVNFTIISVRDLAAFEYDCSFTYVCEYKHTIFLRFCFIKILHYRGFLAALFSHTHHAEQQILFTTKRIITYMPTAGNALIATILRSVFLLCPESFGVFHPSVALENSPTETSVSPFFTESTVLPNCHKMTLFYKHHKIARSFTNAINVAMQRVKNV